MSATVTFCEGGDLVGLTAYHGEVSVGRGPFFRRRRVPAPAIVDIDS